MSMERLDTICRDLARQWEATWATRRIVALGEHGTGEYETEPRLLTHVYVDHESYSYLMKHSADTLLRNQGFTYHPSKGLMYRNAPVLAVTVAGYHCHLGTVAQ